ncbi:MAG TPA: transporter substrate-binding domain-containing protein [Vicinamibacteria bacterium]|nr:transporter substrate-binding domain-containing protein [Vicinamibacteria bacterium]
MAGVAAFFLGSANADLTQIVGRGELRVIVAADEAPETFAIGPAAQPGFERELLEGFARLRKLKLVAVTAPGYAERIPMLQRGEGDVVAAIFDTPDRRQLVDFTAEVMPTHNVVVTLEPRPPVRTLDELKDARVGVIRGAKPAEEAVEAGLPPSALERFERREDLLAALKQGQVAAAILPVSEMAVSGHRFGRLRAGTTVGPRGKVAWAVRKGDADLQAALSEYLEHARRGPTWSRLVVKYFGDQALVVLGRGERAQR